MRGRWVAVAGLALAFGAGAIGEAAAQNLSPPQPGSAGQGVQELPPLPPPNAAVEAQMRGEFPAMDTDTGPSGLIQEAWTTARPERGVYRPKWAPTRVVKVHLREFITTTISLPRHERIAEWVIGDETHFGTKAAKLPYQQHVWVKKAGADSNLNVITEAGTIYSFYLRGETWNSGNIGYQVVEIDPVVPGFSTEEVTPEKSGQDIGPAEPARSGSYMEASLSSAAGSSGGEWLADNPYDPAKIRLDRVMFGDASIAPQAVFRDDRFTYLDYGGNTGQPWPAAWAVFDGIDQPVNTRKSKDGRFFIVETVQPITLRHGQQVVCILPAEEAARRKGNKSNGRTAGGYAPGVGTGL